MGEFKNKVRLDDVKCLKATDAAILVEINGEEHWIPQSQIDDDSEVWKKGDEGRLVISEWLAEKKGLV